MTKEDLWRARELRWLLNQRHLLDERIMALTGVRPIEKALQVAHELIHRQFARRVDLRGVLPVARPARRPDEAPARVVSGGLPGLGRHR